MKELPLSRGLFATVDDEDWELLNRWKWSIQSGAAKKLYASRNDRGKTVLLHRFLLNAPKNQDVDHINGNGLDNRRSNLRLCNRSQNLCNQKLHKNSISGIKGVRFHKKVGKWQARIQVNNTPLDLGYFDSALLAKNAYDRAAVVVHGEFARPNSQL